MLRTLLRSHLQEERGREDVQLAAATTMPSAHPVKRVTMPKMQRGSAHHRPPAYTRTSPKTDMPVKLRVAARRSKGRRVRSGYTPTAPAVPHHYDVLRPAYPPSSSTSGNLLLGENALVVNDRIYYPKPSHPSGSSSPLSHACNHILLPLGNPSSPAYVPQSTTYRSLLQDVQQTLIPTSASTTRYPRLKKELGRTRLCEHYRRFRHEQQQQQQPEGHATTADREEYDPAHPAYDRSTVHDCHRKAYDPEHPGY
jgi:hypothetical protein